MRERFIFKTRLHGHNALFAVALIMMLTISAMILCIPTANAAPVETTCFVYAVPDPVGVNQLLLVTYRIDKLSPSAQGTSGGDHFGGFSVTITDPEGVVTIEDDLTTDSTSTGWFAYYPTKVGTYKFQAHFPGATISSLNYATMAMETTVFQASDSEITEVLFRQVIGQGQFMVKTKIGIQFLVTG